jgi:transposase
MNVACPNCARLEARVQELERVEHDSAEVRRERADLEVRIQELERLLAALQQKLYGSSTERRPRVPDAKRQARSEDDASERRERAQQKREENAARRKELPTEHHTRDVAPGQLVCPHCQEGTFRPLGEGEDTVTFDVVPPVLVRQVHTRRKYACSCGQHIITADGPPRVIERSPYGPGLIAQAVVSKCADATPLHRLATSFKRQGMPIARSTLTDLFHGAAEVVAPLAQRLTETVAAQPLVQADETPIKIQPPKNSQEKVRKGYMWTFLAETDADATLVSYRFSASRSGETPSAVLGSSNGTLVVDAYTGYNRVCVPEARTRAGCWAHARRKFFELLPAELEAQEFIDLIGKVYRVEHEAKERRIVGTTEHHALRQVRSKPLIEEIGTWLKAKSAAHSPRSAFGKAVAYAQNQWETLERFLEDPAIPVDNNRAESALRVVALGRKNFLFVGHEKAGKNLAGLLSLVATCVVNDVNPEHYLADVLLRVQAHPATRIDELLPHNWKRLFAEETAKRLRARRATLDTG